MANTTCELKWIKSLLLDLNILHKGPMLLNCNSQTALHIAKKLVFHYRTKYIQVDCHFICNEIVQIVCFYICATARFIYQGFGTTSIPDCTRQDGHSETSCSNGGNDTGVFADSIIVMHINTADILYSQIRTQF